MKGIPSCPVDYRGRGTTRLGRAWDRVQPRLARFLCSGRAARWSYRLGLMGRLAVRHHRFEISRRNTFDLRVAFAADFHAGATTHPAILEDAFRELAELRADLILLGGDFVAFEARDIEILLPMLRRLDAPLGVFAVLGNHDLTTDHARVVAELEASGVVMLTNRAVQLAPPHDDVWLCGLDDPIYGEPRAEATFADVEPGATRLVLMHAPDGLLAIGARDFDLALCGHTHGGQLALPGGTPIVMPKGKLCRRYPGGVYELSGRRRLLVSHGVGCSTLPLRLFARPEVHLCELVAVRAGAESGERAVARVR